MKKAGRLAAAVFAAMLLVTGCGAPAEKKAVETTPEQSSKIEQKEEAKNLKDAFKKDYDGKWHEAGGNFRPAGIGKQQRRHAGD